ncbi:MAG: MFS transporter [Firmicutes bacterium]|nr:MFS transporter [Bacillota bacterium]
MAEISAASALKCRKSCHLTFELEELFTLHFSRLLQDRRRLSPSWRIYSRARRSPVEENVRYNIYNGVAALISINLVTPFLGIFALRIGATNTEVGLLSALPALVSLVLALPAATLVDRCPDHKHFTVQTILLARFLYVPLALVPLFASEWRPTVLLLMVGVMTIPQALLNVAWQSLIGSVIPPEVRADAFAERSIWMTLSGMAAALFGGWVMDALRFPIGYQLAFVTAFFAGVAEAYFLNSLRPFSTDKEEDHRDRAYCRSKGIHQRRGIIISVVEEWHRVRSNQPYFRFLLATLYFHFAWMGAWPLFTIYRVEYLHADNVWMSLSVMAGSLGSVVFFRLWSRFSKRRGYKAALSWSAAGLALTVVIWIFVKDLWLATFLDFWGGAVTAGINLGLLNRLLEVASKEHHTTDVAYYNITVQLAATVAPVLWTAGYDRWGWVVSMGITAVARALAAVGYWFAGMAEPRPSSIAYTVKKEESS